MWASRTRGSRSSPKTATEADQWALDLDGGGQGSGEAVGRSLPAQPVPTETHTLRAGILLPQPHSIGTSSGLGVQQTWTGVLASLFSFIQRAFTAFSNEVLNAPFGKYTQEKEDGRDNGRGKGETEKGGMKRGKREIEGGRERQRGEKEGEEERKEGRKDGAITAILLKGKQAPISKMSLKTVLLLFLWFWFHFDGEKFLVFFSLFFFFNHCFKTNNIVTSFRNYWLVSYFITYPPREIGVLML